MEKILAEISDAMGNYHFMILFLASFVLLFFLLKGRRKLFLIPAALISVVILNPLFYEKWTTLNDYGYWRTFWVVPVIPVCAALPAMLAEKCKNNWLKIGSIAVSLAVIVLLGHFIYLRTVPDVPAYASHYTSFSVAHNADKLPDDVVLVEEALLEIDDHPHVVADSSISVYHRQYSGKIITPYSRDVVFGTPSSLGREFYETLTGGDFMTMARMMLNYDYDYLITDNTDDGRRKALEETGFELLRQVNAYGIYRVHGKKTELRSYNELGQVISITCLDDQENPVNGPDGYAVTECGYDRSGRVNYVFHRDVNGNGVSDDTGKAGYRREYDRSGKVIKEVFLDAEGNAMVTP